MKTKVFAYLRVSDVSQIKGDGYERQLKACQDYADNHGMVITNVYREAISGTKDTEYRPELAALMVSMEQNHHGVTTVIIERLDRLARDYFIQEAIIRDFQSKGFTLISANVNEPDLCSDDPTRVLLRTVLGGIAAYEKSMLVAKLRAARDRKRIATGRCEGRTQYVDTPEGRELISYIKSLHKERKHYKRLTLQQIADQLNKEGRKTISGKKFTLHRVRDIILDL
jgi:DNA invertase Pin-like site-specific DNA recombinase